MKARIIYEIESPDDCEEEDFIKWLEFQLGVPGACITSDNPLYRNELDFDSSEYEQINVIDG
ncbi:hypothetical protein [Parabacteroides sp. AM08-6]|uniref:hypothetical protein n=1 Tax=Parabacteroides sp. AM08-6 TaxID=2292053 RepID=UPI000EFF2ACB|nr:hypothetical protein [Parabacteroides sp. AM08-6]RHJ83524.1 hypothetical protein DW103_07305 [Parabacteroides sp. AM08-6]